MNWANKWIAKILIDWIAPLTAKMGGGWKTLTGICLLALVQGSRMYLSGREIDPDVMETVSALLKTIEVTAWPLFGIGVYHKVAASDPKAISGAARP